MLRGELLNTTCTGPGNNTCTWLREYCRQVEAEVISNSRNQLHQTMYKYYFRAHYMRDLLSPIREYHHHQHRRHCPLVGWNKSFVSILARISVAAALLARSPPLPKLRSSPRRKGIRVRRPTTAACPRRITTWPPQPILRPAFSALLKSSAPSASAVAAAV